MDPQMILRLALEAVVSEKTVRRWLANPQRIKPGVKMPDFKFTDDQITQLVDYFETLK